MYGSTGNFKMVCKRALTVCVGKPGNELCHQKIIGVSCGAVGNKTLVGLGIERRAGSCIHRDITVNNEVGLAARTRATFYLRKQTEFKSGHLG